MLFRLLQMPRSAEHTAQVIRGHQGTHRLQTPICLESYGKLGGLIPMIPGKIIYHNSLTWIKIGHLGIVTPTNHHGGLLGDEVYPLVNIQKAIENDHRNSGLSHEKMVIFHSYVKLPEGKVLGFSWKLERGCALFLLEHVGTIFRR